MSIFVFSGLIKRAGEVLHLSLFSGEACVSSVCVCARVCSCVLHVHACRHVHKCVCVHIFTSVGVSMCSCVYISQVRQYLGAFTSETFQTQFTTLVGKTLTAYSLRFTHSDSDFLFILVSVSLVTCISEDFVCFIYLL